MDTTIRAHEIRGDKGALSPSLPRALLTGLIKALIAQIVLIVLLGTIAYFTEDPPLLLPYFGIAISAVCCLLAGNKSAKAYKSRGLTIGLYSGLLYVLLLWIISFFFDSATPLPRKLLCYAIGVILSAVGGYAASHKKEKKPKTHRHA